MLEVILFFRRLVGLPYDLVVGIYQFFNSNFNESPRQRALILGLPAIVVAILGLVSIGTSQATSSTRLEPWYSNLNDKVDDQKAAIRTDLLKIEQEKLGMRNSPDSQLEPGDDSKTLEERQADKVEEFKELLKEQQIYLQKLIDLDPENHEHRFELAQTYSSTNGDQQRAIMSKLAPEDKAVFYKAHAYMARLYHARSQQAISKSQKFSLLAKAKIHADHWLKQQPDERVPKEIKARVLQEEERYNEAYDLYKDLFDDEPAFYRQMVQINIARETPENNDSVLNSALQKFKARLIRNKQDDTPVWANSWTHIVRCLLIQKDYAGAVSELEAESNRERDKDRQSFLQNEIGQVYTQWAISNFDLSKSLEERRKNLERLKEAYNRNNNSVPARTYLARYANTDPELANEARKIYNPTTDRKAPAVVLSDLGARALREHDYTSAIDYFERAKEGRPNDPLILNNLAYSYLVSEEKETTNQALYLINDAILKLQNNNVGSARQYLSYLLHTRGTALMRLSRLEEAAASFELSLSERPDHIETLESLIQCYEGRLDEQAEFVRAYLKDLKARESQNNSQQEN